MSILIKDTNIEDLQRAMLMFSGHEIVELPDHGDLIDVDWLKEECEEPNVWWETTTEMKMILANPPVVIPAERRE